MTAINKVTAFSQAVFEQLKSQAAEDGLEKGKRGTVAIPQQIVGYRRSTENIFVGMIRDEWAEKKPTNEQLPMKHIMKKQSTRKRKRGPRLV